jgi:hypothetical protein
MNLISKSNPEPLPFQPEPFAQLCERWPAALNPVYELPLVEAGQQPVPATRRRHVFDFEDGTRLIASVEVAAGASELHLSLGIHSSYHLPWRAQGRHAWFRHQTVLLATLVSAGLITGNFTRKFSTPKADHYWFTL